MSTNTIAQIEPLLAIFANAGIYTSTSTSTSTFHNALPERVMLQGEGEEGLELLSVGLLKEIRVWLVSLQPSRGGKGKGKGIRGHVQGSENGDGNGDGNGNGDTVIEMGRYVG